MAGVRCKCCKYSLPPPACACVAGAAGAHHARIREAVPAAHDQRRGGAPGHAAARRKLLERWIDRRLGSVHPKLLPLGGVWVEERQGIVLFADRLVVLPAQPQVERQRRRDLEVVLHEEGVTPGARLHHRVLQIDIAGVHHPEQEVGKRVAGERTSEIEVAVRAVRLIVIDGNAPRLTAHLQTVAAEQLAEGVADVEDVDKVLIHGPALRWSVMGAHLGYHISGGEGGIDHYLRHFGSSQERRWATLGNPKLTVDVCETIAAGVHAEVGGRDTAELERQRDRQLMEITKLRREHPTLDRK